MALTSEQIDKLDLTRYRTADGQFLDRRYEWAKPGFLIVDLSQATAFEYMGTVCEAVDLDDPDSIEYTFAILKQLLAVAKAALKENPSPAALLTLGSLQGVIETIEDLLPKVQAKPAAGTT